MSFAAIAFKILFPIDKYASYHRGKKIRPYVPCLCGKRIARVRVRGADPNHQKISHGQAESYLRLFRFDFDKEVVIKNKF